MLEWGRDQSPKKEPTPPLENDNDYVGRNPILLSVLKHNQECTELLHQFGYRIPQNVIEAGMEGEVEEMRQKIISQASKDSCSFSFLRLLFEFDKDSTKENPVQSILDFKGYADPDYLTIAFKNKVARLMKDRRWQSSKEINRDEGGAIALAQVASDSPDNFESDLEDLKKLDPLRKAFDLAARAEDFTNDFQGIVELKKNYGDIKEDLEQFTHSLLSQCYNEEEAAIIMKHNPDDDDDDDLDPEEQNWQRALWERRKSFVGHPFYQVSLADVFILKKSNRFDQESIWQQLLGNGVQGTFYRKNRAWFNIIFVPYTLVFFSFLPFVVILDTLFRNADILFITPEALRERGDRENPFFGFFRSRIHMKILRMIMYHWSQAVYLVTLFLVVQNPEKTEENRMGHWYNYLAAVFSTGFLFTGVQALKLRKWNVSKWVLQSIATQVLLLAGWVMTLIHHHVHSGRNVDRADISGNSLLSIAETCLAAGVFMAYFKYFSFFLQNLIIFVSRILRSLLLLEYLGPIIISITRVFRDVLRVVLIYAIVWGAHAMYAWSMFYPFQDAHSRNYTMPGSNRTTKYQLVEDSDFKTMRGFLVSTVWRMLDADDPQAVHVKETGSDEDFSYEFSHAAGIVIWLVYQIIMSVLMINILIAIMNTTYSEVWRSAESEWKFERTRYLVGFTQSLNSKVFFPPPQGRIHRSLCLSSFAL